MLELLNNLWPIMKEMKAMKSAVKVKPKMKAMKSAVKVKTKPKMKSMKSSY